MGRDWRERLHIGGERVGRSRETVRAWEKIVGWGEGGDRVGDDGERVGGG